MGMSTGGTGNQKAEINMTPMIDVLLVLIIIFMVIAPPTPQGLPAMVPQSPSNDPQPVTASHEIVVTVRNDRTVLLNEEALDLASLKVRLTHLFRDGSSQVIFVRGGKDLEFISVAEVIDVARAAGAYRVALMTN